MLDSRPFGCTLNVALDQKVKDLNNRIGDREAQRSSPKAP
jgi:hypothetical protein